VASSKTLGAIDVLVNNAGVYSAANAGVHALVRSLAIELAPDRIRINAVATAVVETPVYSTFLSPALSAVPGSIDRYAILTLFFIPKDCIVSDPYFR